MNKIYLHGHLAKISPEFKLKANTPAQAIRLLAVQVKDFATALRQGYYHVRLGNHYLDKTSLHANLGEYDLHIIPTVQGAGGGKLPLFIGAALLAVATGGAGLAAMGAITATGILGVSWGTIGLMGVGLIAGGISQMLTKPPKAPIPQPRPEDNTSQLFSGLTNTTTQGVPVLLVYGRMRVGSVIVSTGLTNEAN